MSTELKVIYFDAGGTILRVRRSVGHVYADAVRRFGYEVPPDEVNLRFRRAWKKSLERRRDDGYVCTDEILREEWARIVVDSFDGLVPRQDALEAFEDIFESFCTADAWQLAEGALDTLRALAGRVPLGILSNWDSRLEETLDAMGILEFFSHRVISYQVGHEKPHPRIFGEAVRQAGVAPDQILHVGDLLEWDIRPARGCGFHTLWVRGDVSESADLPGAGEAYRGRSVSVARFGEVLTAIERHFRLPN